MIIVVAGMPGSGKSRLVTEFEKRGIPSVSLGDVVRTETQRRGLKLTRENVAKVSMRLRQEFGQDAVAKLAIPKVREHLSKSGIVVVEGVRSLDEIGTFKSAFPWEGIIIVAVHAPPRSRFERLRSRKRHDDPRSWEEFEERDWKELRFGLGNVIAMADYMVVNDGSKEEYEEAVRGVVDRILRENEGRGKSRAEVGKLE
ncbi:MAG: flagellar hook-basal body complex protein FliE [Thermococci archaeon]|nr:flagellar hook-basal body complex protein FliE [Thermococci archaeon]